MSNGRAAAGRVEDYIQGDVVVRHAMYVRVLHWWTAVFFILAFVSGWALFSPRFYFLTNPFGGGYSARLLHPWFALLFTLGVILLFFHWAGQMKWNASDSAWLKDLKRYLRYEEVSHQGKFNAGQKLFFWEVCVGALLFLLTGVVIWFPTSFPLWLRYLSYPLHEILFILLGIGFIYHIYMSTLALGGTLRAMTRGTVTKHWAQNHHAKWYQEVSRK
jgi:formate dehydrogenase subunit gamma